MHSVIAPEAIDQIDAYLGAFDVTYNNAMGGVIDVTPKYPTGSGNGFVHGGIYDSSFGYDGKVSENSNIFIGARRSYYDLALNAMGKASGKIDEHLEYSIFPNYYDATVLWTYNYNDHFFSLEAIKAGDRLKLYSTENEIKDPKAVGDIDIEAGFTTIGGRWIYDNGNYNANSLVYRLHTFESSKLFSDYKVKVDMYRTGIYHISTIDYHRHKLSGGFEAQVFELPLDLHVTIPPDEESFDYDNSSEEVYTLKKTYKFNTVAPFLQDIYEINDAWKLRYGVNVFKVSYGNLGTDVDPRVALIYTINDRNSLSFAAGRYSQIPDGIRIIDEFGNTDLEKEVSKHYGINYKHRFKDDSTIDIEPYYKDFSNLAVDDEEENYVNSGKGYAKGIDLTYAKRSDNLYIYGAYTYTDSERSLNSENDKLYRFYGEIPHTLQVAASYNWGNGWVLSSLLKYHSGKPHTAIKSTYDENYYLENEEYVALNSQSEIDAATAAGKDVKSRKRPVYGDPFSSRLPDYFSLNLKAAKVKKLKSGNTLEYSFEIMNITNHKNITGIEYDDEYKKEDDEKDLPFLPWFDVTYRF